MNLEKKILSIISIFFFVIIIGNFGCGPIKEYPTTPSQPSIGTGTKFRFINCSTGSTPVDLFINNQKVFSYVTFKLATSFVDVGPGLKEFKVRESGKNIDLVKDSIMLDSNKLYALHLVNQFPNVSLALAERPSQPPSASKALIRFAHIDNSLPALDFAISSATENFLITKVPFKSFTNLLEVKVGKNTLDIRNSTTQHSYFSMDAWLQANKIYTVYVFGSQTVRDSTMLTANFLDETNFNPQNLFSFELGTSKIRFINGYVDSTPMEFLVDSARVYTSLAFNQATAMLPVNSGGRNVKVNMSSSSGIVDTVVELEKDKKYSLTVQKTSQGAKAIFFEIPAKTIVGNRSYLRFVNSTTNVSSLNFKITNVNGTINIPNIANSNLSDYYEVLAGQNLIVASNLDNPNLLSSSAFLEGGKVYTAFLFGSYTDTTKNNLALSFIKDSDSSGQSLFTFSPIQTNIRVINGSYDSPALDLLIDEVKIVGGLNYRNSSSITKVSTGRRNLTIKAFGISLPIFQTNYTFEADKNYLLFLGNKFSNLESIVYENPTRQPTLGKSTIR
ncbi:MAG: DUF4397 domain-containing protein, partial [Ignavibacteria bacterium]|nr:DUF4397 domain-containing protein [Ignavibacteria bacterium]